MTLFPDRGDGGRGAGLRSRLEAGSLLQVPGCFDALSARIVEAAGFDAGFLGGFGVAAARLGLPDVGLLGYGEMVDQTRNVCAATSLPIIADADTGYGNPINAERTLIGYAQAGTACMMIEDQLWPKQCGHTAGKQVVDRVEAVQRVRACDRIRREHGLDILIMARTDSCATDGFDEAMWRVNAFLDAGADITFLEAPESVGQMERYCSEVEGWKTVNMLAVGSGPAIDPVTAADLGYAVALHPVELLLPAIDAMRRAADRMLAGDGSSTTTKQFDEARRLVGWDDYDARLRALDDDPA